MSFLNNILSSIGGEQSKPLGIATSRPYGSSLANNLSLDTTKSIISTSTLTQKRKAVDSPVSTLPAKIARTESSTRAVLPTHPKGSVSTVGSTAPARPLPKTTMSVPSVKPSPRPTANGTSTTPITNNTTAPKPPPNGTSTAPITNNTTAPKPPPKGSYREILARAEAAKAAQSDFGQIKHKPVVKSNRRERQRQESQEKEVAKQNRGQGMTGKREGRPGIGSRTPSKTGEPVKERKKPLDLGYKGTMRAAPSEPAYKGTMKSTAATSVQRKDWIPDRPAAKGYPGPRGAVAPHRDYAGYSDEDDEDEEFDDDDESDMEAAGFDVLEEEEQQSLRAAKKEDEEALREENAHRAEKKKRLEALVASKAKKR